jgi:hypothetical protein
MWVTPAGWNGGSMVIGPFIHAKGLYENLGDNTDKGDGRYFEKLRKELDIRVFNPCFFFSQVFLSLEVDAGAHFGEAQFPQLVD